MSLRVALVHSFYSSKQPSGENAEVEAEVQALRRSGISAELFAARTDDLEAEPLYRLRSAVRVATGMGASPLREIEAYAPDVVHVHNLFPNLGRRWVAKLPVPLVVTLHNFRFTCANGMLFRDGQVCTDCPDGHPWSGLRHGCYRGSPSATLPVTVAQLGGPTADPVLARADRILCLSALQRRLLESRGIPRAKLVDWSNFLPAELDPGGSSPSGPREGVICAGRVSSEKGVVELVSSWDSDTRLTVVGDGPQFEDVKAAAVGRNVDVLGRVERAAVLDLMARSAAFIMPGVWPEGSAAPLSYIEALACGLPVVVRTTSEVSARVTEDRTGRVIGSLDEAAGAVALVERDTATSEHCRRVYETRYAEDIWRVRVGDLYASLVRPASVVDAP
jgi:glycosyltransferase involved in cell wall biosynthesis